MTFPVEIGIGQFKLSAHLFFETLAFVAGFRYFLYLRKRKNDLISESNRIWIIIGATFGAFLFSRIVGTFENPFLFLSSEHKLIYFFANKSIVGGLLGGLLMVETTKIIIHEKSSSGDLFTFPLIFAMCIGRIGCFLNGTYEETYGLPTKLFTGMDLGDGLLRHPVTLYEIAFLFMIAALIRFLEKKQPLKDGYKFRIFMALYLLFRFVLDFIKPHYTFSFGIGTIQIFCIISIIYYFETILKLCFRKRLLFKDDK